MYKEGRIIPSTDVDGELALVGGVAIGQCVDELIKLSVTKVECIAAVQISVVAVGAISVQRESSIGADDHSTFIADRCVGDFF